MINISDGERVVQPQSIERDIETISNVNADDDSLVSSPMEQAQICDDPLRNMDHRGWQRIVVTMSLALQNVSKEPDIVFSREHHGEAYDYLDRILRIRDRYKEGLNGEIDMLVGITRTGEDLHVTKEYLHNTAIPTANSIQTKMQQAYDELRKMTNIEPTPQQVAHHSLKIVGTTPREQNNLTAGTN